MLHDIARWIANTVYLVPLQVSQFKAKHPNESVHAAGATKARKLAANSDPRSGAGWITARRSVLILTSNALYCGDWTIDLKSVAQATLLHISSGSVLKVSTTDGSHYQFGIQRDPAWETQTVLPIIVEHGQLKLSTFSIILRIATLILIAWFVTPQLANGRLTITVAVEVLLFLYILIRLISSVLATVRSDSAASS